MKKRVLGRFARELFLPAEKVMKKISLPAESGFFCASNGIGEMPCGRTLHAHSEYGMRAVSQSKRKEVSGLWISSDKAGRKQGFEEVGFGIIRGADPDKQASASGSQTTNK